MTSSGETSGAGDIVRTLELLWDGGPRPSRGPKPGLTLDRIVEAAVRIADEEGLGAVSMRRIATELGTGAMSLYRYVPGKAELLDLMLDRVQRPSENPADLGDGTWRAALEAMARATLALYTRHPWLPGPEILVWAAVRAARKAVRISIFPPADQDAKVYDVSRRR